MNTECNVKTTRIFIDAGYLLNQSSLCSVKVDLYSDLVKSDNSCIIGTLDLGEGFCSNDDIALPLHQSPLSVNQSPSY